MAVAQDKPAAPEKEKPVTAAPESAMPESKATAAASTEANTKLNIAVIGCGGQGRHDMKQVLSLKQNVVAVCDADENAALQAIKEGKDAAAGAKVYTDFRRLMEKEKSIDAVIIATPDHWHAPLCKAFIKAGKHVYCEKPLTRTIGEARELRELARSNSKVITQTGNQASAEASLRRSVELIRAGVLGQVREVHAWLQNNGPAADRPAGEDPVPVGMNWDLWCGPSPYRPYKKGPYHPGSWRSWFDFGTGPLGDFTCHIYNTALRALELTYANKIEVWGQGLGKESWAKATRLKMHFPARQGKEPQRSLDAVSVYWYDGGQKPSDELMKDVYAAYPKDPPKHGCLFVGEKGILFTNPWNASAVIKLKDDERIRDVIRHEPTKDVPVTLPRGVGHMEEWVKACHGKGKVWSDFDFGGHLTEIGLTGVMALRVGHDIEWDAQFARMRSRRRASGRAFAVRARSRSRWRRTCSCGPVAATFARGARRTSRS
jgi:predicted dehydrogenase